MALLVLSTTLTGTAGAREALPELTADVSTQTATAVFRGTARLTRADLRNGKAHVQGELHANCDPADPVVTKVRFSSADAGAWSGTDYLACGEVSPVDETVTWVADAPLRVSFCVKDNAAAGTEHCATTQVFIADHFWLTNQVPVTVDHADSKQQPKTRVYGRVNVAISYASGTPKLFAHGSFWGLACTVPGDLWIQFGSAAQGRVKSPEAGCAAGVTRFVQRAPWQPGEPVEVQGCLRVSAENCGEPRRLSLQ